MGDEETENPAQSWLTAIEAIEKHGVDPIGRVGVRNKLLWRKGGHLLRVFLEDDVIKLKEKKP